MALPYIFAGLTNPQLVYLDDNFNAVGYNTTIPCSVSGTNALVMTPDANAPTITTLQNYMRFSGIVAVTNTGAVTVNVSGLGALNAYKDTSASGPSALVAGDLYVGNSFVAIYDDALNAGAGGFHITATPSGAAGTVTSVGSGTGLTGGPITASGTLSLAPAGNLTIKSNISGGSAAPVDNPLSAILDAILGNLRGNMLVRGAASWQALAVGNAYQLLYGSTAGDATWGTPKTLGVAAAGATQATATALTTMFTEVTSVPAGTGVIMTNPTIAGTGTLFAVFNQGANTLNVYPPVGAAIDGLAVNTPTTIAAGSKASFWGASNTQFYTWT